MAVNAALLRRIRKMVICEDKILVVVGVDSPLLLDAKPQSNIITPSTDVTKPVPLSERSLLVQSVVIASGPREDGTTANANQIFVGGPSASLQADGWALVPGATVGFDAVDLKNIYVAANDALDRVRILFVA